MSLETNIAPYTVGYVHTAVEKNPILFFFFLKSDLFALTGHVYLLYVTRIRHLCELYDPHNRKYYWYDSPSLK